MDRTTLAICLSSPFPVQSRLGRMTALCISTVCNYTIRHTNTWWWRQRQFSWCAVTQREIPEYSASASLKMIHTGNWRTTSWIPLCLLENQQHPSLQGRLIIDVQWLYEGILGCSLLSWHSTPSFTIWNRILQNELLTTHTGTPYHHCAGRLNSWNALSPQLGRFITKHGIFFIDIKLLYFIEHSKTNPHVSRNQLYWIKNCTRTMWWLTQPTVSTFTILKYTY